MFNIQYTPYSLPKSATKAEREQHADERAFFDMTGGKNVFDYITTEGKRTGKRTALEYLQKNTGVFNDRGMIPQEQVDEMKARLKENKGNIWHGFISLSAEESPKIDTPEKCVELIKRTFPSFLKDAKLRPDNIDLMCALHLDRPHHLHIHFVFWEKEPKFKDAKSGELRYRRRGKIDKKSIDGMFVRLGLFLSDRKDILYKSRDEAICDLRELLGAKVFICKPEDVKKEILALARDLPKEGRIAYGSKDMEPYRARVDHIVQMLLWTDRRARQADRRFHRALAGRERKYNGSFIPATQNIADWNANEELRGKTSAIIKNSQYSFIFKLSAPDMKDVLDIYKAGDSFNDEEQRMIISAVTGQTFFVGSTELRNCILVKAGEYTQSLFEEQKEEKKEW